MASDFLSGNIFSLMLIPINKLVITRLISLQYYFIVLLKKHIGLSEIKEKL